MAVTAATIRANFPEFTDPATYPDSTINFWLSAAAVLLLERVWGPLDLLDLGTQLYVCHQITVARRNTATADVGGTPGQVTGNLTQKGVDKVTASYDGTDVKLTDGGFWNLSTYGVQFLQLARLVGMSGAMQVNTPGPSPFPTLPIGYTL